MSSPFESLPSAVHQRVAYWAAVRHVLGPPSCLYNLLCTSHTLNQRLSLEACPELYATLFQANFDLSAVCRRFRHLNRPLDPKGVAAEFVQRLSLLRRIRRSDYGEKHLQHDLWTAYIMLLESDGLNELQLIAVHFPQYIDNLLRTYLRQRVMNNTAGPWSNETLGLLIWLYWLSVGKDVLRSNGTEQLLDLLSYLRPFSISQFKVEYMVCGPQFLIAEDLCQYPVFTDTPQTPPCTVFDLHGGEPITPRYKSCQFYCYGQKVIMSPLDISSGSILVTFMIKDSFPRARPHHLVPARADANTTQRPGPTVDDYATIANYTTASVTSSFSLDFRASLVVPRSMSHDQDFYRLFPEVFGGCPPPGCTAYIPGTLTGLWEGGLMVSPSLPPSLASSPEQRIIRNLPDFITWSPMQFRLQEHLCFVPNVPLPTGIGYGIRDDDSTFISSIDHYSCEKLENGLEFYRTLSSARFRYETLTTPPLPTSRNPLQALDVFITGETEAEHGSMWGAYKAQGRARVRDGLIILRRDPVRSILPSSLVPKELICFQKNAGQGYLGSWLFEGRLYANHVFAGRWRLTKAEHGGIEGVFCLHKVDSR